MNKTKCVITGIMMVLTLTACGNSNYSSTSSYASNDSKSANDIIWEAVYGSERSTNDTVKEESVNNTAPIKIASSYLSKDYSGQSVIIIEYQFTNPEDKATSFSNFCTDKAYQNGVELGTMTLCEGVNPEDQLKNVQPGVSYNVKVCYVLDDRSDVNVVVTEWIGSDVYLNETISLG